MESLQEEIVNKTFVEFVHRGYKACSMSDLERVAGVTKGAFYYYFKGKKELLYAGIDKYLGAVQKIGNDEKERVSSLWEYILLVLARQQESAEEICRLFHNPIVELSFFRLILEITPLFPEIRERIDEIVKKRMMDWEEMIRRAQANGEISAALDSSVLAYNLMAVSNSMISVMWQPQDIASLFKEMRMQFEQYYALIKR